jgi:hypothetical protein
MERLQSRRVWLGGGGLVGLLVIALAWFVFIGPQLSSAGDLQDQAATTRLDNEQLQVKLSSLEAKRAKLPQYTSSLKAALAAIPYDSGLPAFTRQLDLQAQANHVTVNSVLVGGVTSVVATTATPATGEDVAGGTPAAPVPTASGGLYSMQVTVQSAGSLSGQLAFVRDIQVAGPRRALIAGTQITPGAGSKTTSIEQSSTFTTQLNIFSAPRTPAEIRQLQKLLSGDLGG